METSRFFRLSSCGGGWCLSWPKKSGWMYCSPNMPAGRVMLCKTQRVMSLGSGRRL